ncbi:TonB-dependent receptor [Bacteroidia bacterium]|nr:TonB-dependent receptor [Bacteroidia bacterium]
MYPVIMKFRLILALCFAGYFSVFAQSVKISGVVSDPTGLPIELATVQVKSSMNGAMTDEKGRYAFSVGKSDSLTVVFSCLGYSAMEVKITDLTEDRVLNVRMRARSYELETAVVTASRIQTNTMERINQGQGRLSVDATGGSIESFVMTAGTGVSSTNELSTQYSVRGGNYNENIVYVNGIEVYRPLLVRSGQQEGLSFINPDLTEAVHFSSGGFDARYGDKMSSVLDILYKKPDKLEGGFMGSMLGGSAYLGSASGKFTQITGIRYKRGTTLLNTLDTKGDYNPTAIDVQTYMTYAFTPKWNLNLLGNYSENSYDFNPGNRETSWGAGLGDRRKFKAYFDGMERDRFRTLFGAATLKHNLAENAEIALQVSGFQSQEEEAYDITGEYWLSNVAGEEEDVIGTGLFHRHARNRLYAKVLNASLVGTVGFNQHTVRGSFGVQQETIRDRIGEWELQDSVGYSLPYNEEALQMFSNLFTDNQLQSTRIFGYVQDTYKFRNDAGLFSLIAGIRGSYWNYNREFIFSPRASLGFVPSRNQHFTFRFATGLYYQPPFYKEFRIIESDENGNGKIVFNQDIRSQRSIHFVLGSDYQFKMMDGRPFKLTTELYYKKLDDLIPYTLDNVRVLYQGENISDGYAVGIDTKLFGEMVPGTDSWLGFSLMQAKQNIDGQSVPMPTDQRYNITFYFTDYMPGTDKRLQANLRMIWAQGLPFGIPNDSYIPVFRAPTYRRVDFGMSYHLWREADHYRRGSNFWNNIKNIWLGVDVFNLLDIKNVVSYSWFNDTKGHSNAVPDYLTGRQTNIKCIVEF